MPTALVHDRNQPRCHRLTVQGPNPAYRPGGEHSGPPPFQASQAGRGPRLMLTPGFFVMHRGEENECPGKTHTGSQSVLM